MFITFRCLGGRIRVALVTGKLILVAFVKETFQNAGGGSLLRKG